MQPAEEFSTLAHEIAHEMLHRGDRRTLTHQASPRNRGRSRGLCGLPIGRQTGRFLSYAYGQCPRITARLPSKLSRKRLASPLPKLDVVLGCGSVLKPDRLQDHKATASASVSRTCLVVNVRRSPRWSISWAISCASVENSSAGCIPESNVIFPPCERPFAERFSRRS